jgi:predicted amidohydrolase
MGFGANTFAQAQSAHYDLLLKGGHVIDPANDLDRVADVAITAGG